MKCLSCLGDGSVPAHTRSGLEKCRVCDGGGQVPFWSPSERAGIKTMGKEYRNPRHDWLKPWFDAGVLEAIRAFVSAARKIKEGR